MTAAPGGRLLADEGVTPEQFEALTRRSRLGALGRIAREAARRTPPGARVLDLGCGPGWFLALLAEAAPGASLTGVDPDPGCLRLAEGVLHERGARARLAAACGTALPFPDGAFDLVACLWTLHHFADPAPPLREAARVLAPGGALLLVDFRPAGLLVSLATALLGARLAVAEKPETRALRDSIGESHPLARVRAEVAALPFAEVRLRRTGLGFRLWARRDGPCPSPVATGAPKG